MRLVWGERAALSHIGLALPCAETDPAAERERVRKLLRTASGREPSEDEIDDYMRKSERPQEQTRAKINFEQIMGRPPKDDDELEWLWSITARARRTFAAAALAVRKQEARHVQAMVAGANQMRAWR